MKGRPCPPQIQIGCQTDYIPDSVLKRAPSVYEHFPITMETTTVHNLWGGLIYLLAPPRTQVVEAEVKVHMAVLAPYYKTGEVLLPVKLIKVSIDWIHFFLPEIANVQNF